MNNEYTIELKEATLNNADKFVIKTYYQDDVATHNHNFFELVYIIGGSTYHTLNGVSGSLGLGDYFIVDYGSVHCYAQSKDLTLINCLFLPEIIDDTLKGCCSFDALLHVCLLRYYKLYLGKTSANRINHMVNLPQTAISLERFLSYQMNSEASELNLKIDCLQAALGIIPGGCFIKNISSLRQIMNRTLNMIGSNCDMPMGSLVGRFHKFQYPARKEGTTCIFAFQMK